MSALSVGSPVRAGRPGHRRRRSSAAAPVVALAAAGLLAGCDPSAGVPAPPPAAGSASPGVSGAAGSSALPSGRITVFAAASLSRAFTTLGRRFEAGNPGTTVRLSFGASSTLAQQIIAGAPADVFASAATTTMQQVSAAGDAPDPHTFAANVAEIAVAPSAAARITSLADLTKPGVRVAVCQPQVPCGVLARRVFAKAGVAVHPVTEGLDVTSTLRYVTSGQVDAALVYVTDVRAAGSAVRGVPVPAAENERTDYPIATVRGGPNPALAAEFEAYVLSPGGVAVLTSAGFEGP